MLVSRVSAEYATVLGRFLFPVAAVPYPSFSTWICRVDGTEANGWAISNTDEELRFQGATLNWLLYVAAIALIPIRWLGAACTTHHDGVGKTSRTRSSRCVLPWSSRPWGHVSQAGSGACSACGGTWRWSRPRRPDALQRRGATLGLDARPRETWPFGVLAAGATEMAVGGRAWGGLKVPIAEAQCVASR